MAQNIITDIEREYLLIRNENKRLLDKNFELARRSEAFCNNESAIKETTFEMTKAEFFDGDLDKAKILKQRLSELKLTRASILKKLNLKESDLTLKYTCEECKDTGYVNGCTCKCFNEKWKAHTFATLNVKPTATLTFKDDTATKSPKLTRLYDTFKKYVEKFPHTNTNNFLFTGKTGCGKTYLATIIAGELTKKGFNSVFVTASEINQLFLKMHLAPYSERIDFLSALMSCDFLVIDDLGTENIYKNVTTEYLLSLISERLAKGKHTIITTNLEGDEIMLRYNERLFSRITEKRFSAVVKFEDTNFRTNK